MTEQCRTLSFPVLSHCGREVLPAGSVLDDAALVRLRELPVDRRPYPAGITSLVRDDLERCFENPVYEFMFRKKDARERVFSMLDTVEIPRCAVELIEHFRGYDFYTYRHMLAVFAISTHLLSLLSSSHELDGASIGSLSHDIGKCSVPRELLHKQAPLTPGERRHIEHHAVAGYALIHYYSDNASTALSAVIARDHHESRNGTGYPSGIRLDDLRTEIVIASDIYDALLSERPYRKAPYDNRTALEELTAKALDGRISMSVIQALVSCSRKQGGHWSDCIVSAEKRGAPPLENNYGKS